MARLKTLSRGLAIVAVLAVTGTAIGAAPASAARPWKGGCTAPTYGPEIPPTSARATCDANMDAVAVLSGTCGSVHTTDFEFIRGSGFAYLNIECYNYGRLENAVANVSPIYQG